MFFRSWDSWDSWDAWDRLDAWDTWDRHIVKQLIGNSVATLAATSNPYAEGLEHLRYRGLARVSGALQAEAALVAAGLIERFGPRMVALGWQAGDLFDCPLVLGTAGTSIALDARRAGLAWVLTGKARVLTIERQGAKIENPNGQFDWRLPRLVVSLGTQ